MKKKQVSKIINNFKDKKIAVIGDLMLDVYLWGKVDKISPEAPVPVVQVKKKTFSLGGAANVMRNITSLGGSAIAFGLIGDGDNGKLLFELMEKQGIKTDYITTDHNYVTIEKQRVIADSQQLVRVDFEDKDSVAPSVHDYIKNQIISMIEKNEIDAVIFEDYAKGLLTSDMANAIITAAKKMDIPVVLDPHPSHKLLIKGLSLMTPNQSEAFTLAGMYNTDITEPITENKTLAEVAKRLNEDLEIQHLLITLGPNGMALFEKDKPVVHIPTMAQEVFDVTGAGDTVIASYTLALLGGATGPEAAAISNHAAGIVVGRVGTSSVTPKELIKKFK